MIEYLYRKLVPTWAQDPDEGAPLLYTFGRLARSVRDRARDGLAARFPGGAKRYGQRFDPAPDDALSLISRDRKIVRGIDEEPEAFALRLIAWLDDHRNRGNAYALMRQVRGYCNAAVRVRTVDARGNWYTLQRDGSREFLLNQGNWNWDDADAARWSRFWVIIYPTTDTPPLPWDVGPTWGAAGAVWGPDRTWGTTATRAQVREVRAIVRDWKPAGTTCVRIVIAFDDASFDPTAALGSPGMPNGTWGTWSNGEDPARTDRLRTARYWKGTGGPTS